MANHRDRLALLEEVTHERHSIRVRAHLVRIRDAARHDERVVLAGIDLVERAIDRERVSLVVMVRALDRARAKADELRLPTLTLHRVPGYGQLDLLDHVRGEKCHLHR